MKSVSECILDDARWTTPGQSADDVDFTAREDNWPRKVKVFCAQLECLDAFLSNSAEVIELMLQARSTVSPAAVHLLCSDHGGDGGAELCAKATAGRQLRELAATTADDVGAIGDETQDHTKGPNKHNPYRCKDLFGRHGSGGVDAPDAAQRTGGVAHLTRTVCNDNANG